MHCLWCHEEIIPEVTWVNFLNLFEKPTQICKKCEGKLTIINGEICPKCSRPTKKNEICADCIKWEKHPEHKGVLNKNVSVFSYSPFMKEIMNKWKYRGDYVLVSLFEEYVKSRFKDAFGSKKAMLVPIPLSQKRQHERGFNQAEAIAKLLKVPIEHALVRVGDEKQAKKSRKERIQSENPFRLVGDLGSDVVLIDDLYTTGTTLRWAASLLRKSGVRSVDSFTLIRS